MNIAVVGTGYVGLVVGACLAETGNDVVCADIDVGKIATLNKGEIPIYEPGLKPLVEHNLAKGRLSFTTDVAAAVQGAKVIFIAVGTPPGEDGSADLKHVLAVANTIGESVEQETIVITKSTVPVGTAPQVRAAIEAVTDIPVHVCSNPEFLKEGAAVDDFMKPDRVVLGVESDYAADVLKDLYAPFVRTGNEILLMDIASAEITKYAANAMLATKISFMNELANIAECVGADIEQVRIGIGSDPRIGYQFIYPGAGYGGSCFPKDVRALAKSAAAVNYEATLLESVEVVNMRQKQRIFQKIADYYGDKLDGLTIAVWGLAFKPRTDDMREASSRVLMEALWEAGATVRAYDPESMDEARRIYGDQKGLTLCDSASEALEGADALAIMTEWQEFRSPDFEAIKSTLKDAVVFDGRNLYDPDLLSTFGIAYYAIGRSNASLSNGPMFGRRKTDRLASGSAS